MDPNKIPLDQQDHFSTEPTEGTATANGDRKAQYKEASQRKANELLAKQILLPAQFFIEEGKLFYEPLPKEGSPQQPIFVCGALYVLATTCNVKNENHGLLLSFLDIHGVQKSWTMPRSLLAGSGEELRQTLLSMGLRISAEPSGRKHLMTYLMQAEPQKRTLCVDTTGWFQGSFVMPNRTIMGGDDCREVCFQSASYHSSTYSTQGTAEEWKEFVGKLCNGNVILIFIIGLSFAAPLLRILGLAGRGIHLVGDSSTGKTTALQVAASVWGHKIETWRSTANGLEAIAVSHNDTLLSLDELGQMNPEEVGDVAYLLANGLGKIRANRHGDQRASKSWTLTFLSTGEISFSQHIAEGGKRARAGQEVRVIDLRVDCRKYKVFDELHNRENGAVLSRELSQGCKQFCGAPAQLFLEQLVNSPEEAKRAFKEAQERFLSVIPANADGQVRRVGEFFACIAAAGELAVRWNITSFDAGTPTGAAIELFEDWIERRGGVGASEDSAIEAQIRAFFEEYGGNRFARWGDPEAKTAGSRVGFWKEVNDKSSASGRIEFYVFKEAFRKELCRGFSYEQVCRVCVKAGLLIPGPKGEYTRSERLPGVGQTTRCCRFVLDVTSSPQEQLYEERKSDSQTDDLIDVTDVTSVTKVQKVTEPTLKPSENGLARTAICHKAPPPLPVTSVTNVDKVVRLQKPVTTVTEEKTAGVGRKSESNSLDVNGLQDLSQLSRVSHEKNETVEALIRCWFEEVVRAEESEKLDADSLYNSFCYWAREEQSIPDKASFIRALQLIRQEYGNENKPVATGGV